MDEAEYWILDSVVEGRYRLSWLVAPNIGELYNRHGHGLTYSELLELLGRLFAEGDLLAWPPDDSPPGCPGFRPTRDELERALTKQTMLYYGLTPKGGARWEACSAADWNRYVAAPGSGAVPYELELIAGSRAFLEEYLLLDARAMPERAGLETMRVWDKVRPWHATGWKVLQRAIACASGTPSTSCRTRCFIRYRRPSSRYMSLPVGTRRSSGLVRIRNGELAPVWWLFRMLRDRVRRAW